jgi:putative endonuclease
MYYIYAIQSLERNYIYVGLTLNVIDRYHRHQKGYEKTTSPYRPYKLIFSKEVVENRALAREVEKYFKSASGKRWLKKNSPEVTGLSTLQDLPWKVLELLKM